MFWRCSRDERAIGNSISCFNSIYLGKNYHNGFMTLDKRLEADTIALCKTASAHVRLMNDSRWPWLILIPVQSGIEELHDLTNAQRDLFMTDVNKASRIMQSTTNCQSVNVAMLGNVVSQLHCHIVARNPGDTNWPAPIWGVGVAQPYDKERSQALDLIRATTESFS